MSARVAATASGMTFLINKSAYVEITCDFEIPFAEFHPLRRPRILFLSLWLDQVFLSLEDE